MPIQKDTAGLAAPQAAESLRTGSDRTDARDLPAAEGLPEADSLAGTADSLARDPATDSLAAAAELFSANADGVKEVWDAQAVYGPGSRTVRTVQHTPVRIPVNPVSGNIGLQIIVLTAAAAWCLMAYRFREQVKMCVGGFFNLRNEDKFSAEQGHFNDKLTGYAIPLYAVAVGIFVTKAAAAIRPGLFSEMPSWVTAPAALAVGAAFLLVFALQCAVIALAGRLTLAKEFARAIIFNKKLYLTVTAVMTLPLVAIYTGLGSTTDIAMGYVIVGVAVMVALFFVLRTMMLFIRQKVSLLVWILYLCAIEIFPAGFVTLLAAKYI